MEVADRCYSGMSAITFTPFVFIRDGRYRTDTPRGLALIAHEAVHIGRCETGVAVLSSVSVGTVRCGFRHDAPRWRFRDRGAARNAPRARRAWRRRGVVSPRGRLEPAPQRRRDAETLTGTVEEAYSVGRMAASRGRAPRTTRGFVSASVRSPDLALGAGEGPAAEGSELTLPD